MEQNVGFPVVSIIEGFHCNSDCMTAWWNKMVFGPDGTERDNIF